MKVKCPKCDQKYEVGPSLYGKQVNCSNCGQAMQFPTEDHAASAPAPLNLPKTKRAAPSPTPYHVEKRSHAGPIVATLLIMAIIGGIAFWFFRSNPGNLNASDTAEVVGDLTKNEIEQPKPETKPTQKPKDIAPTESPHDSESDPLFVVKPEPGNILISSKPNKHYSEAELQAALDSKITPYFEKHCLTCHGPKKEKGDLRVDQVTADMSGDYAAFHLQNIIDEMTTENMPPEDEPRPDPEEAAKVIEALTAFIEAEEQRNITGGGRPIRRLTRTEFINTSYDFYGVKIDAEGLPDDLLVGKFEGDVKHLYTTDLHIESYMRKARQIVKVFIADRDNPKNPQAYNFFKNYVNAGESDSQAHAIIQKFAILAKRGRPTGEKYGRQLLRVFQQGRKDNLPFWVALEEPLAMSICSIDSLLHFEQRSESGSISGLELANRLSYTLWKSAPDFELVRLGRSGELLDPKVKEAQVKRMMKDQKFDRFIIDFSEQWFELPRQDEIAVDTRVYRKFDVNIKPSMKEETIAFFRYLVEENLPITNLVDSEFMMLNAQLAEFYGIPGVKGNEFRPVSRDNSPESKIRGGIVTHAGILMQGGTGDRSSIVERGAFITRKLLDAPPADPPPNVEELPTSEDVSKMTGAELVKLHANIAQCAGCHSKIDPLGVALENFDAIGQFRTEEKRLNPRIDSLNKNQRRNPNNFFISVPIETKGVYYNGEVFDGVLGLKKSLMKRKDALGRGYVKALISNTNGREVDIRDNAIINELVTATSAENYPARDLIEKLMLSKMLTSF